MKKLLKTVSVLIIAAITASIISSCGVVVNTGPKKYSGPYSTVNGTYGGVDDLGRVLISDNEAGTKKNGKEVGIFYFLWQGEHGTDGPYDNSKIVAKDPTAILSEENWIAAGGGPYHAHHFWGEPLFGYYTSKDVWVLRKHAQMLADADVDFIAVDATNGFAYIARRCV